MEKTVVICSAQRTPMGSLQGCFSNVSAPELGATAIQSALKQCPINVDHLGEVIMGCVLSAGIGQAPARQAAHLASLPDAVGATTLNKMCGSGLKAIITAHDSIQAGNAPLMLAGGLESMTQAPYLLKKARNGYRLGHSELQDHLFLDGLEDAYDTGKLMGWFAEETAKYYQFSREMQDLFALESLSRARIASEKGYFKNEIAAVTVHNQTIFLDESLQKARPEKIPHLRPAFQKKGTVTAANSSSISDGAAALLLSDQQYAQKKALPILAKIVAHASHAQAPAWFTTAPVSSIEKVLHKANWQEKDVDLFEINEAFAVVTLAAMKTLKLDTARVNVNGGACALGHPIGASGARIVVTLIHALRQRDLKRGIAALCIGGGEALAIAIELESKVL